MNLDEIEFIRSSLPEGRTKFYTFKDQYAFNLLSWKLGDRTVTVNDLKKQQDLRNYIHKPALSSYFKEHANGRISSLDLSYYWPKNERGHVFRLTLDQWGSRRGERMWHQTSRDGYNLVLQLNFLADHDKAYASLGTEEDEMDPCRFAFRGHPVRIGDYNTMSWARLDIDLNSGTSLIEEIQNDWLRRAHTMYRHLSQRVTSGSLKTQDQWKNVSVSSLLKYYEQYLNPIIKQWEETTLWAAIWFLKVELGINQIHYHSWESGIQHKGIDPRWAPPKSIYTQLPQRFGFTQTDQGPEFITNPATDHKRNRRKKHRTESPKWWFLNLNNTK